MSSQIRLAEQGTPSLASQDLAALEPRDTDKWLDAALPAPIKDCMCETHGPGYVLRSFEIQGLPAREHQAAIQELIAAHEFAMRPAPIDQLKAGLARVLVMTKTRSDDEREGKLRAAAYLEELQRWPADVALHVLTTQPRREKWFPAWAELEERLELFARQRTKRLEALKELSLRMMIRDALVNAGRPMTPTEIQDAVGTDEVHSVLIGMRFEGGYHLVGKSLRETTDGRYEWVIR